MSARYITIFAVAALTVFSSDCTPSKPSNSSSPARPPIEKAASTITLSELDALVRQNFSLVTKVADLPETVRTSFCNIEHCNFKGVKFDMVNPGDPMSTDYVIPGVPNKRLRFAALNDDAAIISYEWGGYANQLCVTVFDFRGGKSWGASLKNYHIKTLDDLRAAILAKDFVQWAPGGRS